MSELLPALMAAAPAALLIILVAVVINAVMKRALRLLAHRTSFSEQDLAPVRRAIKWVITLAALVFVLGAFGLNVGGMWGVLSTVLAMVAIGFVAVWSVLSNMMCTVLIILTRPFAVGDEVEFVGEPTKGRVKDLNFIYTTLDAGDGTVMQVPNNLFFQKVLRRRHGAAAVSAAAHIKAKMPEEEGRDPIPEGAVTTRG